MTHSQKARSIALSDLSPSPSPKSLTIGVCLPDSDYFAHPTFQPLLSGISHGLVNQTYDLLLTVHAPHIGNMSTTLQHVDGVIRLEYAGDAQLTAYVTGTIQDDRLRVVSDTATNGFGTDPAAKIPSSSPISIRQPVFEVGKLLSSLLLKQINRQALM